MVMSHSAEAKLHELRNKTNQQLTSLIDNKLDRGLTFARLLQSDETRRDWSSIEYFHGCAERALSEASAWMPLLTEARKIERRRLEIKLAQLRDALAHAEVPPVQVHAAC